MGLFVAVMGFTYALATSGNREMDSASATQMPGVKPRSVGSNLVISNPFLLPGQDPTSPGGGDRPNDPDFFDLGDATIGSQVVRYISARNGVRPYRVTATAASPALVINRTGQVLGGVTAGPSPANILATVTDAAGSNRVGNFRLFTFNSVPNQFRFAMDRLPSGSVGQDYITNVEVLGGDATTTNFTVLPGSVSLNGASQGSLENVGLALNLDGTLYGRPLVNGTLSFTARATRGGINALNRSGTASDQNFSITINALSSVQSMLGIATSRIKVNLKRPFRDGIDIRAFANLDGQGNTTFSGKKCVVRIFGTSFSTTLDAFGEARNGDIRVRLTAPDGLLRIKIRNSNLAPFLSPATLGRSVNVPVQITIGDTFLGTDAVQFKARTSRSNAKLSFTRGKQLTLGGSFQVLTLKGADSSFGTSFRTRFLMSNVQGNAGVRFGQPSSATVNIGPAFTQTLPLRKGKGKFRPDGIAKVNLRGHRGLGELTTYPLPTSLTGIEPARTAVTEQTFLLGLGVTTDTQTFFGETARRIFPVFFFR